MAKLNSNVSSEDTTKYIRIGIVGLGMGKAHIDPYLSHPMCRVEALCDVDERRLTDTAAEYNIKTTYTTFEDLIARAAVDKLDAVSIATPNFLHEPFTVSALAAGLHVLCEKPLAMNALEGQNMLNAAKKANRKLAVHYNTRLRPEHQHVRAMYDAGELGEIAYIHTGWVRQRGIPSWGSGWFCDKAKAGGGSLIDVGVHMIDAALYACGYPEVISVTGKTFNRFGTVDAKDVLCDVDDMAIAYIRCANDTVIVAETSWASHTLELENVFCSVDGKKAGAHWKWTKHPGNKWTSQLEIVSRVHGALTRQLITEFPKQMPTVQYDFVQAIIDDREPLCSGEQGLVVMKILDAIYESCKTGVEVRF